MSSDALKSKNLELETLQRSYDDYIESSKELEGELEIELKASDTKLIETTTKKIQAESKLAASQEKLTQLSKELTQVQNELEKVRGKLGTSEETTKKLESSNDTLLDKVRILEATEEDLMHKLENAEEDIVFLQSDIAELKEARSGTEQKLRAELATLQAEIATLSASSGPPSHNGSRRPSLSSFSPIKAQRTTSANTNGETVVDATEQSQLIEELELEVDDLTTQLAEAEQQNTDLNEEVNRLSEELMSNTAKKGTNREIKLETLVKGLNTQLSEAKDFLIELEESNSELEESNAELYLANSDLDTFNIELAEKNAGLKDKNMNLREENLLLEERFLASKAVSAEMYDELEIIKRELAGKCRLLEAAQDTMDEVESEQSKKEIRLRQLSVELAAVQIELESAKGALNNHGTLHTIGNGVGNGVNVGGTGVGGTPAKVHTKSKENGTASVNGSATKVGTKAEAVASGETETFIIKMKQTITDLSTTEMKKGGIFGGSESSKHDALITELRTSVETLSLTIENFEWNMKIASAQLAQGKEALNNAEFERDVLSTSVQKLGEKLLKREMDLAARADARSPMRDSSLSPVRDMRTYSVESPSPEGPIVERSKEDEMCDAWNGERSQLMERLEEYRKEIDESRAQAAMQQRRALLEDFGPNSSNSSITAIDAIRTDDTLSPVTDLSSNSSAIAPVAVQSPSAVALLGHSTSIRIAAERAIASDNVGMLKSELTIQLDRYDTVRATNAKLLQKLQAVRGNIQVCCRTRSPTDKELAAAFVRTEGAAASGKVCVDVTDENEISCYDRRAELWRSFAFDRVWPFEATQAEVFGDVEPLVLSVTEGFNTCLFAYGQTGSGKTFTMNGYGREYGVSYRTLQRIFETLEMKRAKAEAAAARIDKVIHSKSPHNLSRTASMGSVLRDSVSSDRMDKLCDGLGQVSNDSDSIFRDKDSEEGDLPVYSYSVQVSMMEIYNEQVYDLLTPSVTSGQTFSTSAGSAAQSAGLDIRQAPDGTVSVPGLHQVPVRTLGDVMEVFARGSGNRATTATNLNEHSSRSHLIMLIDVDTVEGDAAPVKAKLFLVDLAGSERVGKSGVTGQAMKEAQYINKSLSALGDVMEALDQKAKFVPYRNSKLTYLLQDAIGGNSRTMMVVTVCPTETTSEETLFTLQFASRVRNISLGAAKKNANSKNLEEAVKALKAELKESKKKRQLLEDNIGDIKKDQKKSSEKSTTLMDVRLRAADDKKNKIETQLAQLQKTNAELAARWQEEKEGKQKVQEQLKEAVKGQEKERQEKDRERMERDKERQVEKEGAFRLKREVLERERSDRLKLDRPASYKHKGPPITSSSSSINGSTAVTTPTTSNTSHSAAAANSASSTPNPNINHSLILPDKQDKDKSDNKDALSSLKGIDSPRQDPRPSSSSTPNRRVTDSVLGLALPSPQPNSAVANRSTPVGARSSSANRVSTRASTSSTSTPSSASPVMPPGTPGSVYGRTAVASSKPPVPKFSSTRPPRVPALNTSVVGEEDKAKSKPSPRTAASSVTSVPVRKRSINLGVKKTDSIDDGSLASLDLITATDGDDDGSMTGLTTLTPSVRTNIANRSKEALQRHQERMEKRRADKLLQQLMENNKI